VRGYISLIATVLAGCVVAPTADPVAGTYSLESYVGCYTPVGLGVCYPLTLESGALTMEGGQYHMDVRFRTTAYPGVVMHLDNRGRYTSIEMQTGHSVRFSALDERGVLRGRSLTLERTTSVMEWRRD